MEPQEEQEFRRWVGQGLGKVAPLARTRALVESGRRDDADFWAALANLGVLGLGVDEAHGGTGSTSTETALFLMEAGRLLVPGGYLGGSVIAPWLLRDDVSASQDLLPAVAGGQVRIAYADLAAVSLTESGGTSRLSGTIEHVPDADLATHLLIVTSHDDVFVVESCNAHVTVHPSLDETRPVSTVVLDHADGRRVLADADTVQQARSIASLAIAAESAGAMSRLLDITVDYAKTRTQFGGPIGRFQAVKHRCTDMFVSVQASTAMVLEGFARCDETGRADALTALATETFVSDAFVSVAKSAMQLHGGIAFTWEHDVHLYLKRARSSQSLAGSADRRVADLADRLMDSGESVLAMLALDEPVTSA